MLSDTPSLSISQPHPDGVSALSKAGLAFSAAGILVLLIALAGVTLSPAPLYIWFSILAIIGGAAVYAAGKYLSQPAGIKNNGVWQQSLTARGIIGWMIGIVLTGFYVLIYWWPQYLGLGNAEEGVPNTGLIHLFDPLSNLLHGDLASEWFMYGVLYTVAILAMGIKFLFKYRGNRYHTVRTLVVIGSQLVLAFFIPEIIAGLKNGGGDFNTDIKLLLAAQP